MKDDTKRSEKGLSPEQREELLRVLKARLEKNMPFYDCSAESPKGRRSVCYDREALESGKEHKPEDNAVDMAAAMGIELLTKEQLRKRRAG